MESWIANLVVQVISGAVGGTVAGGIFKDLSLGKGSDAIAGAIGGGLVGQVLASVVSSTGGDVAGGMDIAGLVKDIVGSGIGGAVVMAVVGLIRNAMTKS